ncbi:Calcium-dependent protein kinase 5 (PfCDPK5) [Durusdinium trenchii]|uniref:Calcium-dependent protein kinase 5 (PfCDPK5) n=1 Tax=Durusdinium trenchii TaxID=1381693 RepID=A0ABP0JLL1_9DINO
MPGLALPSAALRPHKLLSPPGKSPQSLSPAVSPARNLPGTLLPLTGVGSPCSNESGPMISPQTLNLKALIPDHVDEDIFDRYDFEDEKLGAGGYGSVYLAKDRFLDGRIVAVKKALMMDGDMRENFQQEVQIMKELDHPNICRVYESYDHGRHVYLVMEYCAGGDLFDYILKHQGIPEATCAKLLRQIASALKHAHDKGIAHRDLKPENVCFDSHEDPVVKLIDWGLGFYFRKARMTSSMVGSNAYTAPEVMRSGRGSHYTNACDLWSLGAMASVMLSGEPPHLANDDRSLDGGAASTEAVASTGQRQRQTAAVLEGAVWEPISSSARDLVEQLLSWDPAERPSAEEVLNHPFLRTDVAVSPLTASQKVLDNLHRFSKTSKFLSLCSASVAQQLSRRGLKELQGVFQALDTNGDGMLQLHEVRSGFQEMFGPQSRLLEEIDEIFERLDIDGSGAIDYTEFLAAGLGNRVNHEVDALWAAFKAFDVQESDGHLTKDEIAQVLFEAGGGQMWSREKCEELAREVVEQFDRDGNGSLDFDEWLLMMRRHEDTEERRVSL